MTALGEHGGKEKRGAVGLGGKLLRQNNAASQRAWGISQKYAKGTAKKQVQKGKKKGVKKKA